MRHSLAPKAAITRAARTAVVLAAAAGLILVSACGSSSDSAEPSSADDSSQSTAEGGADDCQPAWEFDTIKPGVIQIAAVSVMPGLDVDPNTDEVTGIDADLLNKFAAQACKDIKWNRLTGAAAVAAMSEGQMDIGGGQWSKSEARAETIGQLEGVVFYNPMGILSMDGNDTFDSMQGRTWGVEGGSIYQEPLTAEYGDELVKVYESPDAEVRDMLNGRVDAVYANTTELIHLVEIYDELSVDNISVQAPNEKYAALTAVSEANWPFTKGNTELGAALDAFLEQERESGDLAEVLRKYGLTEANITGEFDN